MLPKTHRFIIEEAIGHCGLWAQEYRIDILRGSEDEDVFIVPLVGWRLRAAGLTHTHVPQGKYGELGFPSAKKRATEFLSIALKNKEDPKICAWWLGRACHLLGDTAVPARARRIWHLEGDPLEAWLEKHLIQFAQSPIDDNRESLDPDDIFEEMARLASSFPADTTRTPWGRAAWQWFNQGKQLDENEFVRQARVLVPMTIKMTRYLISWVERHRC
jgi:hypothetical protein